MGVRGAPIRLMSVREEKPCLSIVIPAYNEEENLEPLIQELEQVLDRRHRSYEIICVDDCSTDHTPDLLRRLQETRPYLQSIRHRLNFGQSAAEVTGFRQALADIVVTLDGDGQNDPADIPALLDALGQGVAAVCGVRRRREDDLVKRISSRIANGFRNMVTGDGISDAGCACRAMRREALLEVPAFNGMHRFLPTMLRFQGYEVKEIPVHHRPRIRGVSKYGVGNRMWRGLLDCFAILWFKRRCFPGRRLTGQAGGPWFLEEGDCKHVTH
jgi:dolichol-phosphate mannosyltransferase